MKTSLGLAFFGALTPPFLSFAAGRPKDDHQREVPPEIFQELRSRGCVVEKKPKNIIQGQFIRKGQTDWAALCATKKSTNLLLFPAGAKKQVAVLEAHLKGFAKWSISVTDQEELEKLKSSWGWKGPQPTEINHQGISSVVAFGEPGGRCLCCYSEQQTTHYWEQDSWLIPVTIIVN